MDTTAVVFEAPFELSLTQIELPQVQPHEVVVDIEYTGVSTGTEKLLWTGEMPPFPGLSYPLVPGYESVGRVIFAGEDRTDYLDRYVFVPGAKCYGEISGLFGGAASRITVDAGRVQVIDERLGMDGVLLALAATAYHALAVPGARLPDLIVGHGVLGRLLARLSLVLGGEPPVVWEQHPARIDGAIGYEVTNSDSDSRRDYHSIYDVSGDAQLLNALIQRLAPQGEIALAGFYREPVAFDFPPAFMREARFRVAAEWRPEDMREVYGLLANDRLDLSGLVTHVVEATDAIAAYDTAFNNFHCLKMVLDWRNYP